MENNYSTLLPPRCPSSDPYLYLRSLQKISSDNDRLNDNSDEESLSKNQTVHQQIHFKRVISFIKKLDIGAMIRIIQNFQY